MVRDLLLAIVGKNERDSLREALTQLKEGRQQLREITLALETDWKQQQWAVELTFVPRPGKEFAAELQDVGTPRSRFSRLTRRAPLGLFVHTPVGEEGKEPGELPEEVLTVLQQFVEPKYRAFLKVVPPLAKGVMVGGLDWCLMVSGRGPADVGFCAGLKIRHGRQVGNALRDALKDLPTEVKDDFAVEWNHAREGEARIHKLTRFLGKEVEGYLAIREDVVFFGNGKDGLKAVKDALEGFTGADPPVTPLFEVHVSGAGFLLIQKIAQVVEKALPPAERDKLWARVSVAAGKDLRLRLEGSMYLLKLAVPLGGEANK
jgi:hypothetical protein